MRTTGTLTWTTLLTMLALSGAAHAKSQYVAYIPNGNVKTCNNCHPGGNTAALTSFGDDVLAVKAKPTNEWWPALADQDSDQDGQTNGQELGDPCNDWLVGKDPARTTAISNPGDAASKSADPDNPPCGGGGAGGGTTGSTGQGGAPDTTTTPTDGTGATMVSTGDGSAAPFSAGAGKADPPVSIKGSCSTAPVGTGDGTFGLFGMIALYLLARSRHNAPR